MKRLLFFSFIFIFCLNNLVAQKSSGVGQQGRIGTSNETDAVMSDSYWKLWNPEVQAKIDRDIEQYRKANAVLTFKDLDAEAEVKVEQVSHDFIFGAHIFNFNQLGTVERNRKYKELYSTLFNSATISFYWKKFEMQPNRLRFKEEYWDTEEYWNQVKEPELEPHWRRPASDPVVEFCIDKNIYTIGHLLTWGNRKWHYPEWIYDKFCPENEKELVERMGWNEVFKLSATEIENFLPNFTKEINRLMNKRMIELANYYGNKIDSWDIANESTNDFEQSRLIPNEKISKSHYGIMPGDYVYESFKTANRVFPNSVKMNISDSQNKDSSYVALIEDLVSRGIKIDILEHHMHLFNPQQCLDIADGKKIETPEIVWNKMRKLSKANLPIHLSEVTITSPGNNLIGKEIQAVIARNLYRLWFSIEKMIGITWWNVVDDCGAPGEPTISGLFTRNMEPKPSFYTLNKLINEEWKTNDIVKVKEDGTITFRGFKGRYIISWKDKLGKMQQAEFYLKNDGDGFQTFP